MAVDPVCGMEIDEKTSKFKVEYEDKVYHFCCGHCKDAFVRDPGKYMK